MVKGKTYNLLLLPLLIAISVVFSSCVHALEPGYIKGTYLPLTSDFRHVSPINGAMWWEGSMMRKLYEYGILTTERSQKDWLPPGDGPAQLTHALFNIVQGGFGISYNKSYPAAHLSARTIAHIIATLEKHRLGIIEGNLESTIEEVIINDLDFQNSVAKTRAEYEKISNRYNKEISNFKQELILLKKKERPLRKEEQGRIDELEKRIKELQRSGNIELSRYDVSRLYDPDLPTKLEKIAAAIIENERELADLPALIAQADAEGNKKLKGKLYKRKERLERNVEKMKHSYEKIREGRLGYRRVKELVRAIARAYNAPLDIYQPYTAYSILTAFMYRKIETKEELFEYFDVLNTELGGIFDPSTLNPITSKNEWLTDNFGGDPNQIKKELTEIQNRLNEWLKKADMKELTDNLYEEAVYGQITEHFYKANLPRTASHETVMFEDVDFIDCVETPLRNLCNIILYNRDAGSFDTQLISTINPVFEAFYKKHPNATNISKRDVHQNWSKIVENQPWVAYNQTINTKTKIAFKAPEDTNGFIIIPPEMADKLTDGEYVVIAGRRYIPIDGIIQKGFEMQPSIRNIIILLNQIFELILFENITQDFLRPNFNATYLPKLAEKLNKLYPIKFEEKTIDTNDYTTEHTILTFPDFSIDLTSKHCELFVTYKAENIADLSDNLMTYIIAHITQPFENYPYSQLFSIYPLSIEQFMSIAKSAETEQNISAFPFIYFLDLSNNLVRKRLAKQYLVKQFINQANQKLARASKALLLIIIKELTEQTSLYPLFDVIDEFPTPLIQSIGNHLLKQAKEKMNKQNINIGIELLEMLTNKEYTPAYPLALESAQIGIFSKYMPTKGKSSAILHSLAEKKYELKKISETAGKVFESPDNEMKLRGLLLFKEICCEGDISVNKKIIEAATKAMTIRFKQLQEIAMQIFGQLVDNQMAYEEANNAASYAVTVPIVEIRQAGIQLFKKLIEVGYKPAREKAVQMALQLMRSDDPWDKVIAKDLFNILKRD